MIRAFILTGGYLGEDLEFDFGTIPVAALPLGNKRLLDYQIDYLTKYTENITIVWPEGNKIDGYDRFAGLEVNPCKGVLEIIKSLLDNSVTQIFHYGDSLFGLDFKVRDTIVLGATSIQLSKWTKVKKIKDIDGIICGLFVLKKGGILHELFKKSESWDCFADGLQSEEGLLIRFDENWLDFGSRRMYSLNKIKFLEARHFNSLSYNNGWLTKYSKDVFKMSSEYEWLKLMSGKSLCVPRVRRTIDNGYSIEYKDCPTMSDLFTFGKHNFEVELAALKLVIMTMYELRSGYEEILTESTFICDKLIDRYHQIDDNLKPFLEFNIIESCIDYFSKKTFRQGIMHGDLCYSNILYDRVLGAVYFIDPRGYLSKNHSSMTGLVDYDYYKLAHSFVCGYDRIIAGQEVFSIEIMETRLTLFLSLVSIERKDLLFGLIQLFISMIPLHSNRPDRQRKFVAVSNLLNDML